MRRLIVSVLIIGFLTTGTVLGEDFISITSSNSVRFDNKTGTALMTGDVVITLKSTGSVLRADEIALYRDLQSGRTRRIEATGNVKSTINMAKKGRWIKIKCDQILADQDSKLVVFTGSVNITAPEAEIKAETVQYDFVSQTGSVTTFADKRVHMGFWDSVDQNFADQRKFVTEVWAAEIRLEKATRKITFQGDVEYQDHINPSNFVADKSDLYFDPSSRLNKVIAFGNIHLEQQERSSSSDQMFINYNDKLVTMSGNVIIQEPGKMEIRSSLVKMSLDSEKGFITGANDRPIRMNLPITP